MKNLIYFILMTALCACNYPEKENEEIYVIDPTKFSDDKFTLSTIAADVSYIPLSNQEPIGLNHTFAFNKCGIFVSTKKPGLLHFDKNGKFLKLMAKQGRGPSELRYGMQFAVDEENGNIYVNDVRKIKVYQLNGQFVRSFSTNDFFDVGPEDIKFFNSSLFLADYGEAGSFKNNWIVTDTLGNRLSYKNSNVNNPGFLLQGSTYSINDKLVYYNWLNDTIFSIHPDFSFTPRYLFAQGDYRWRNDFDLKKASANMKMLLRPISMFESKHFVFFRYAFMDKESSLLMIDKKSKETYQGYVENCGSCMENDFDGGLHFLTNWRQFCYYKSDYEYIVTLITPFDLKAHIASDTFKNSTPKYPEKKKALKQLADSLDENDNPVLMVVKLKD